MNTHTNETHQHILNTGHKLIVSRGFTNVGLAEILKAASVPKGSFYYYFTSKEQFGEELIKKYFREYLAALDQLFQAGNRTAYERLLDYWQRWLDTQTGACVDQKCLVVKLSAEVADLSEPMRLALLDGSSQVVGRIAQCIEAGIHDGSISRMDSRLTAELLYNMWLGASLMNKLHRSAEALQRVMDATMSILSNGTVTPRQ